MQFKKSGNRIQVLAYRGYDTERRRSVVRQLGSISGLDFSPSVGLMDNLTVDEKTELQAYIEKARQERQQASRRYNARNAAEAMNTAAEAITDGTYAVTTDEAAAIWSAIAALTKSLRRAGHPRPTKPRKIALEALSPPKSIHHTFDFGTKP
jgi:hypothetical protein